MKTKQKFKIGDIYEDCAYHPVRCEEVDGDDISGVSLIDGSRPRSCSINHCGVVRLNDEEARQRIQAFQDGGERGLMRLRGWNDEQIDKFMREWR